MLADMIHKLAHEVAADWAGQSLQFSGAEEMGRSLARNDPEMALTLLKTAAALNKEALGLLGKGLVGAGLVGTGVGAVKGVQYAAKRHKQFQHTPYRHGMAGPAHFQVARQM